MKNILNEILEYKQYEVEQLVKDEKLKKLLDTDIFYSTHVSLAKILSENKMPHVIAEFKRKSPSKGWIKEKADVKQVVEGYIKAGASALSVLTDTFFFGAQKEDIISIYSLASSVPVLRKDFIISHEQIQESKGMGADIILLIASCLSPNMVDEFAQHAKELGMEILLEIHNEKELYEKFSDHVDFIGINNRNLETFETSLETSKELIEKLPDYCYAISESGIDKPEDVLLLHSLGFHAFLIGENFMKALSPPETLENFLSKL